MARPPPPPALMAPGGLDYLTCNAAQLASFIKKRTGQKLRKDLEKVTLAQRLLALDREPGAFRFLDLPAELRNNVYEELLTIRSRYGGSDYCYPKILQASKEIHSEASSILYAGNKCNIDIKCHEVEKDVVYCSSSVLSRDLVSRRSLDHSLSGARETWPAQVLQFSNLDLSIGLSGYGVFPDAGMHKFALACALNNTLYSLCGFLSSSNSLKEIKITLTLKSDVPASWLQEALWPLSRMPNAVRLHLVGFPVSVEEMVTARDPISDESIARVRRDMRIQDVVSNADLAINHFQYDLLAKLRAAGKKSGELKAEISWFQREGVHHQRLNWLYYSFYDWLREGTLITEQVEVKIRAHLIAFDKECAEIIASIDRAMEARMKAWKEKRKLLEPHILPPNR